MKKLWQAFAIAFSMYSAIPMPQVEWNKSTMKYAICFLPFVGVAVGLVICLWLWFCSYFSVGAVLCGAVATSIPILITGGIHLDGFCDTMDALCSHGTRERKLEILKDSHIGAFAMIGCLVYLILNFGLWSEFSLNWQSALSLGIGYIFSRALSGFAVCQFQCAKDSGLVYTFADNAGKQVVKLTMIFYCVVCSLLLLWINWQLALSMIVGSLVVFIYYRQMSYKLFGGITGDLAGYFLQICELVLLIIVVAGGRILL